MQTTQHAPTHRARAARRSQTNRPARFVALAAGGLVLVLAALFALKVIAVQQPTTPNGPVPPDVFASVTNVPATTFQEVGRGSALSLPLPVGASVRRGANGLPLVTYIGAEYCPYCAAERWSLVVALSRFGQFSGLTTSHSAADDVFPNTPTFSFVGSSYSSPYLDFSAVELQSNVRSGGTYPALQTPTPDQQQLLRQYDGPPYVPTGSAGAIPFIDIADQYVISGASYDVGVLRGQTLQSIAQSLSDPTSPLTQGIIGGANEITAAICAATGDTPQAVCGQQAIQSLEATLAAAPVPAAH
ncbi:MAG TPA: DUF929 family protein [Chloroflexota bacterium]|jgi:hypothetical protein|nr:DUF929 family protein [Chloroflexota bacterium]